MGAGMTDARDKAITAMVDAYERIRRSVAGRYDPGDHRIARELLDAIPVDVLVDLAIDRGALVPAFPADAVRLYRRAMDGGGDG
jgi:hypothetical protein